MKLLRFITLLALAAGFCACVRGDDGDAPVSIVNPGDRVPSFSVSGPDGTFGSAEFEGRRSLLILFASYCPDCQAVLPRIHEIWSALKDHPDDHLVVAISRGQPAAEVAEYWAAKGYGPMPYYLDPDRSVYGLFATGTIPRIYIIDAAGTVERMWIERLPLSAAELLAMVAP